MLFAVLLTDTAESAALRAQHLPAHLAWLAEQPQIRVAGSLRESLDARPRGGLWIVEAESKAAVQALIDADPFTRCGLRLQVEILHWSKAFADRQVPV